MEFRKGAPEDAASVQRVARESWHTAHDHIIGENAVEDLLDEWYSQDGLEESIDREDAPVFLATDDGEVIGFAQGDRSKMVPLTRSWVESMSSLSIGVRASVPSYSIDYSTAFEQMVKTLFGYRSWPTTT
jgi:hypothetical protein